MVDALAAGCDLVDVARFAAALERRPAMRTRVFTRREIDDCRRGGVAVGSPVEIDRLAARFAAKEAVRKALRDLRLPFHAIEVRTAPDGAPDLWVHGEPSGLRCSLAHDGGMAMAVVFGMTHHAAAATASRPHDAATTDATTVEGRR